MSGYGFVNNKRLIEAASTQIDEDYGWSRITGNDYHRDLNPIQRQRAIDISHKLWESNFLADRMIELPIAYLVGEGVKVVHENKHWQDVLTLFWKRNYDGHLKAYMRSCHLVGDLCQPVFSANGTTNVGFIPPWVIKSGDCDEYAGVILDPDNPVRAIGIVTNQDAFGVERKFKVVYPFDDNEIFTQRTIQLREQFADGECFYFKIKSLPNGRYGRGDLIPTADFITAYDDALFSETERNAFMKAFFWDIELTGKTQEEINKMQSKGVLNPPQAGGVRAHNESVKWNAVAPNLNQNDSVSYLRFMRNIITSGLTLPSTWFADGADANRANSEGMSEPTFKVLTERQEEWRRYLIQVCSFVLKQAGASDKDLEGIRLDMPELTAKDTSRYAAAMAQATNAVVVQIGEGLITREVGARLLATLALPMGVEYDAVAELEKAQEQLKKEKEEQELKDASHDENPFEQSENDDAQNGDVSVQDSKLPNDTKESV